ncbi:MAG: hypothetical protein WA952_01505 [Lewinella sp.]
MNEGHGRGIVTSAPVNVEEDLDKFEFNLYTAGPAKTWWAYSDGYRERRNRMYGGVVGNAEDRGLMDDNINELTQDFSQRARLRFNLFCNGGNPSEDCGCRKRVDTYLMYESEISTRAQLLRGGGTKQAQAAGEDVVMAYTIERNGEPGGIFNIQAFNRLQTESSCGARPNQAFYSDFASLVSGTLRFVAPVIGGGTSVLEALEDEVLEELLQQGVDLSFTPSVINSGNCGTGLVSTQPRRLIEEDIDVYLEPNTPLELGIASRTRLLSTGMRSWQSEVVHRSGYIIAAVEKAGKDSVEDRDPACCTDRTTASYISKAIVGEHGNSGEPIFPINSIGDLRRETAGFIIEQTNHTFDFQDVCLAPALGPVCFERGTATPFEFGKSTATARYDMLSCLIIVDPGDNGGIPFPRRSRVTIGEEDDPDLKVKAYDLAVYSTMGQLVGQVSVPTKLYSRNLLSTLDHQMIHGQLYVVVFRNSETSAVERVEKFIYK